MSIIGLGTDIVEIDRLQSMPKNTRNKLAKRVLTPIELAHYHSLTFPVPYLAKRWAGKEAASKALGTGIAKGISFQHFLINKAESGQPIIELSGKALIQAKRLGATCWHISLSDEKHYALATVIISN